jgi:hypothetical protein
MFCIGLSHLFRIFIFFRRCDTRRFGTAAQTNPTWEPDSIRRDKRDNATARKDENTRLVQMTELRMWWSSLFEHTHEHGDKMATVYGVLQAAPSRTVPLQRVLCFL